MKGAVFLLAAAVAVSGSPVAKQERTVVSIKEGAPNSARYTRYKRSDGTFNFALARQDGAMTQAKYKAANRRVKQAIANGTVSQSSIAGVPQSAVSRFVKRASTVALTDEYSNGINYEYYANVGIETQQLPVLFDTGSADLWVPVTPIPGAAAYFDTTKATGYVNTGRPFQITYASGNTQGTVAYDTVYLGGIPSRHQFFGAVTQESNNFNGVPFAGILGFGFQAIAATGSPAPIENLNNFNRINGQFGFHLADQTTGSTLTLGGFDPNYSGTLTFTPVVSKTFWEVSSTLYANGAAVGPSYYSAIDTGTTLWYVPSSIAAAFYAKIPGAQVDTVNSGNGQTFYVWPCANNWNYVLSFPGALLRRVWQSSYLNLGTQTSGSNMCVSGLIGMDFNDWQGRPLSIVGDIYLKNTYVAFDYNAFGTGQPGVGFTRR